MIKNKDKRYLFIILSFILFTVLSNILLIHTHILYNGWDTQFHLKRINEFISQVHHLEISPFSFNQFNGSAVMAFYPHLNLLVFVALSYIIHSKILLIYLFFGINTFISLIISFISSKSISKNIWTSYVFSIIYSIATPLIGYNYVLMDIGSSTALTFLPLIVFGFIHLLEDNHYIEMSIGLILISFCHILSLIIIIGSLIILLIINYRYLTETIFLNIIKAGVIISCITSIIWVSIIYIIFNNKITSPALIKIEGLPNKDVLSSLFGGYSQMGLGTFVIISILLSLFFFKYFSYLFKRFYLFSVLNILICSKLFPWNYLPHFISFILSHFQFTYRFLIIPILLLDYIFSVIITKMYNNKDIKIVVVIISLIMAISLRLGAQHHFIVSNSNQPYYSLYDKNNNPVMYKLNNSKKINELINIRPDGINRYGTDYYPKNASPKVKYINNNEIINDKSMHISNVGNNEFLINVHTFSKKLILPLIYYNGTDLRIYSGHHLIHFSSSKNNLITIFNVPRGSYRIRIQYVPNTILIILKLLLVIIGFMCLIIISIKKCLNLLI